MRRKTLAAIDGQPAQLDYAQAVKVGPMIWIVGTPACDETLTFPDDVRGQLRQAYENLETTLSHFDSSLRDLVEVTVFVSDLAEYVDATATVRTDYFPTDGVPVSVLVRISRLLVPPVRVLIKATAVLGSGTRA